MQPASAKARLHGVGCGVCVWGGGGITIPSRAELTPLLPFPADLLQPA